MKNDYFVHETSYVDDGANIGSNSKIWHFSHICAGAVIGNNCVLGQNSYVGPNAIIGNNVKIQNNISIYDHVIIQDDVFCGPSVVFTNVYNPRSFVNRKNEFKKTLVCKGATLGANATIVCGININAYAFVGAGTLVNKDIKSYALVVGNPAKQIGWVDKYGNKLDLPVKGKKNQVILDKNKKFLYELNGDSLTVNEI